MRVKVVWVTHFSNKEIRNRVHLRKRVIELFFRSLLHRPMSTEMDYCYWVTKSIVEFERINDIEVHVVAPLYGLAKKEEEFELNGLYYHFFRSDDDSFFYRLLKNIYHPLRFGQHRKNRLLIKRKIEEINPSVVHFIGAENPYYSLAALDLDRRRPLLISLQTLMSDSDFFENYAIDKDTYDYRANCERAVIQRADYICSTIPRFNEIIRKEIRSNATFLNLRLLYADNIRYNANRSLRYDFVYFARNINKSCDIAIEAFNEFHKYHPKATLYFVGGYDSATKTELDTFILEHELTDVVFFSGELPSHDDVIAEIQKAKFALLPLKIDVISTTLLEAMQSGLPIVSTITPGTPGLNKNRESILLSEKEDIRAISENMCKLYDDDSFAATIRENAFLTVNENYNNFDQMRHWADCYIALTECKAAGNQILDPFIVS